MPLKLPTLESLLRQREELQRRLNLIEEQSVRPLSASTFYELDHYRNETLQELEQLNKRIEAYTVADKANQTVQTIANEVEGDLDALRKYDVASLHIEPLEKRISHLVEVSGQTIQQLKTSTLAGIEPKLSILRPNVKLVDANLAYKYADLQSDTNILIGFTTLFMGTGISAAISLGISLSTSAVGVIIAIHAAVTIMSIFVASIFGYLSFRARRKSEGVRKLLETEIGEKEITLRLVAESEQESEYSDKKTAA